MFKKICTVVIASFVFFNVAFAQTVAPAEQDLLTIIKQLQAQIQSMQAQMADLKAEVQSVKLELKFSRALAQGSTGDDVKQLQEFLKTFTGSYPNGLITGYYGPLTATAVKRFQEQNGIESVGVVGPITQAKLNMLVTVIPGTPAVSAPGTGTSTKAPTPTFFTGTGLNVSLASNNPFTGPLEKITTPPAVPVPVLAVNLTAGNDSAMTVSELGFHEKGVLPDSSISDAYLVENGKVLYKYSSISDGVIDFNGLSLSVAAGQMRTMWLVIEISGGLSVGNTVSFGLNTASDVAARDASNNLVTASGSFPVIGNIFTAISVSNLSWGTPAPSTYSQPSQSYYGGEVGPATPAIQAVPGGLAIPATPATLCKTMDGVQIQPSVVTVLSPNGGEQWQVGGTYTIKYSAKDTVGNKALLIYLEKGYDAPTTKTGANSSLLIGATTNLESYVYTVPNNIGSYPGSGSNYKITIMVEGSSFFCDRASYSGDSSDAEFSIVAGQYNVPPATSAGSTLPGGTTASAPASGGGYGAMATPMPFTPTIVSTQEKIANIQAQISALQNQLNTTTDDGTRASLKAQIAALQTVIQELQTQIFQGQLLPVATPTPIPTTYTTPQATPTTQEQMNSLLEEISAYQNKLNNTTDIAARDSLMAQIIALKARIQILESNPTTPAVQLLSAQITALQEKLNITTDVATRDSLVAQILALKAQVQTLESNSATTPTTQPAPAVPTLSGTTSAPVPISGTSVSVQIAPANQDKINSLFEQINVLGNQLNSTIDTAVRDSLVAQIIELKAQVQALQNN